MIGDADFYFSEVFRHALEKIVCVDRGLNILFATAKAYDAFGMTRDRTLHLDCIISVHELNIVSKAIESNMATSFKFRAVYDNQLMKCILTPIELSGEKYAQLLFQATGESLLDEYQKKELKTALNSISESTDLYLSNILMNTQYIDANASYTPHTERIEKNVMRIKRSFINLSYLTMDSVKVENAQSVEVNSYIMRITRLITMHLGIDRIEFELDLVHIPIVIDIPYDVLDVLVCNIVSNSVKNTEGKTHINVRVGKMDNNCVITFSDNGCGCNINELMSGDGSCSGMGIMTIRKIATDNNGKLYMKDNPSGGTTTGILFPEHEQGLPVIFQPEVDNVDLTNKFSTIGIYLSDIPDEQ